MRAFLYIFLYLAIFSVYFYFDIVTDFFITHGIVKLLRKLFKKLNFRKIYNNLRSLLPNEIFRFFLLKIYNFFKKS